MSANKFTELLARHGSREPVEAEEQETPTVSEPVKPRKSRQVAQEVVTRSVGKRSDPNFERLTLLVPSYLKESLQMQAVREKRDMSEIATAILEKHLGRE